MQAVADGEKETARTLLRAMAGALPPHPRVSDAIVTAYRTLALALGRLEPAKPAAIPQHTGHLALNAYGSTSTNFHLTARPCSPPARPCACSYTSSPPPARAPAHPRRQAPTLRRCGVCWAGKSRLGWRAGGGEQAMARSRRRTPITSIAISASGGHDKRHGNRNCRAPFRVLRRGADPDAALLICK